VNLNRIHKYDLSVGDNNVNVMLPDGAQILSVAAQHGIVRVWILLDPNIQPKKTYRFTVVGTGWDIQRDALGIFIGTAYDGEFVWHVFARDVLAFDAELARLRAKAGEQ